MGEGSSHLRSSFNIIAILGKGSILSELFAETQWIAEEELLEVLMNVLSTFYCNCSISNLLSGAEDVRWGGRLHSIPGDSFERLRRSSGQQHCEILGEDWRAQSRGKSKSFRQPT